MGQSQSTNTVAIPVVTGQAITQPASTASQASAAASTTNEGSAQPGVSILSSSGEVKLSCSLEHAASGYKESVTSFALASLLAPEGKAAERLPLEVVVVADRSGSMNGDKMTRMKEALTFLVTKGLLPEDTFTLIAFDNQVQTRLQPHKMNGGGRQAALSAIDGLQPGGSTNLSGGMLSGIDTLLNQAKSVGTTTTRAVLVFTDGLANQGITQHDQMREAVKNAIGDKQCTLFTFGFGADHSEDLLRSLAESTNGIYYYIEKAEDIPQAFADCLGGLVSVVAQNAVLSIKAEGAKIRKVHGIYSTRSSDLEAEIQLGDLYSEDEKDLLFELQLPVLSSPLQQVEVAHVMLRYFSVSSLSMMETSAVIRIDRPGVTPTDQPVNLKLDEQKNRIQVAEAMKEARMMADAGEFAKGRQRLSLMATGLRSAPSRASPLVQNLLQDLDTVSEGYEDKQTWKTKGTKMSQMSEMCHMQQRSNHVSALAYEKKGKRAMKGKLW